VPPVTPVSSFPTVSSSVFLYSFSFSVRRRYVMAFSTECISCSERYGFYDDSRKAPFLIASTAISTSACAVMRITGTSGLERYIFSRRSIPENTGILDVGQDDVYKAVLELRNRVLGIPARNIGIAVFTKRDATYSSTYGSSSTTRTVAIDCFQSLVGMSCIQRYPAVPFREIVLRGSRLISIRSNISP